MNSFLYKYLISIPLSQCQWKHHNYHPFSQWFTIAKYTYIVMLIASQCPSSLSRNLPDFGQLLLCCFMLTNLTICCTFFTLLLHWYLITLFLFVFAQGFQANFLFWESRCKIDALVLLVLSQNVVFLNFCLKVFLIRKSFEYWVFFQEFSSWAKAGKMALVWIIIFDYRF